MSVSLLSNTSKESKIPFQEPIILQHHLQSSLESTRSSLSQQEYRKLKSIYDAFLGTNPIEFHKVSSKATLK